MERKKEQKKEEKKKEGKNDDKTLTSDLGQDEVSKKLGSIRPSSSLQHMASN